MVYLQRASPIDPKLVSRICETPGFQINQSTKVGSTCLVHAAVFRAPFPVFRDLIERGADVNVALSSNPKLNVMERYLDENSKTDPAVVKLLLEKGFD